MVGHVRFGTSSFSEKSWVGPFYPPHSQPRDFLSYYATQFDTVEVDATYYAVPDERVVAGWNRKLPEHFQLSAKFPRTIVHCGEQATPDPSKVLVPEHVAGDTALFLERMQPLGTKLGPLVLQFPWFSRRAPLAPGAFVERLAAYLETLPAGLRYGVEVRNRDYVGAPLLDLLREHRVAFVLSEIAGMPHPADVALRHDVWTADFAYGRLIGDRKAVERHTKTFERTVLDKDAELRRWAELIGTARERVPETYVYANNHYAGHGPATIRRLQELVEEERA